MPTSNLVPINGTIQSISPLENDCCHQMVSIRDRSGINNFIVGPDTYIVGEMRLRPGMIVTAFYDASLPIPLIYPPQYQAVIITRRNPRESIYAGFFDENLTAEDHVLRLNISSSTEVVTSNGQQYPCSPAGQFLIVYYTTTTRSIPPQTTPRRGIVMC